jgi:hypothetical protein
MKLECSLDKVPQKMKNSCYENTIYFGLIRIYSEVYNSEIYLVFMTRIFLFFVELYLVTIIISLNSGILFCDTT